MKGTGRYLLDDGNDPLCGSIYLLSNGWVLVVDTNGITHSFSPALEAEIIWNGKLKEVKDE